MDLIESVVSHLKEDEKKIIQELIMSAENQMLASEFKIDIPHKDYFSKDVYAREIQIPKGTFLVGKIHKFENLNILSKGEMTIVSIEGMKRVKAPYTIVSPAGVKRLAFAHEDSVWTTIHGTSEKNVDKIEKKFIAKDFEEVKNNTLISKIKGWLSWLG